MAQDVPDFRVGVVVLAEDVVNVEDEEGDGAVGFEFAEEAVVDGVHDQAVVVEVASDELPPHSGRRYHRRR